MNFTTNLGFMESLAQFLTTWGTLVTPLSIGIAVLMLLVHIVFAVAVYRDARGLDDKRLLVMVGPGIWSIATLLWGVLVAGLYWAVHHSRLSPNTPMSSAADHENRQDSDISGV